MPKGKITKKQLEILDYIKAEILRVGYPPAVREICKAVNLKSTSSVHSHLETLEKNGYIRRDPTKPRAIEVIDDTFNRTRKEMVNVPIVAHVTAGESILAEENISGHFSIPNDFISNHKDVFLVIAKENNMTDKEISNGSYILIEQSAVVSDGEKVIALIDGEAAICIFRKEDEVFRLYPQNDTIPPMMMEESEIIGKIIGVFRFFH